MRSLDVLDLTMLTFLFLFALIVVAIILTAIYRRGFNDGERFGAAREEVKVWREIARARERVEALGEPRVEDRRAEWELPE